MLIQKRVVRTKLDISEFFKLISLVRYLGWWTRMTSTTTESI